MVFCRGSRCWSLLSWLKMLESFVVAQDVGLFCRGSRCWSLLSWLKMLESFVVAQEAGLFCRGSRCWSLLSWLKMLESFVVAQEAGWYFTKGLIPYQIFNKCIKYLVQTHNLVSTIGLLACHILVKFLECVYITRLVVVRDQMINLIHAIEKLNFNTKPEFELLYQIFVF